MWPDRDFLDVRIPKRERMRQRACWPGCLLCRFKVVKAVCQSDGCSLTVLRSAPVDLACVSFGSELLTRAC